MKQLATTWSSTLTPLAQTMACNTGDCTRFLSNWICCSINWAITRRLCFRFWRWNCWERLNWARQATCSQVHCDQYGIPLGWVYLTDLRSLVDELLFRHCIIIGLSSIFKANNFGNTVSKSKTNTSQQILETVFMPRLLFCFVLLVIIQLNFDLNLSVNSHVLICDRWLVYADLRRRTSKRTCTRPLLKARKSLTLWCDICALIINTSSSMQFTCKHDSVPRTYRTLHMTQKRHQPVDSILFDFICILHPVRGLWEWPYSYHVES